MNIALVINELDIRGGTHKQFLRFCQYCEKTKIEFDIFTKFYNPETTYPEFSKFRIFSLTKKKPKQRNNSFLNSIINKAFSYECDRSLFKLLNSKQYDIINVHDNGLPNLMHWCSKIKGTNVVWQINDLPGCFKVGVSENSRSSIKDKIKCLLYKRLVKSIDLITVNVSKNKDRVIKCLNKDAVVLYCGVDKNDELSIHHFISKDDISILTSGVFFTYRNYETQIEVIKALKEKGYSVYLDIIGSTDLDKEYSSRIINLIEQNGLTEDIKIWGQVDEETYINLHNNADMFCFINVNQSWGLAVFEAMSCGLPVIVSESVGATEILNNGKDSVFVNPFDVEQITQTVVKLHTDEDFYNRISTNAKNAVSKMSWDEMYSSKLIKCFNKLYN